MKTNSRRKFPKRTPCSVLRMNRDVYGRFARYCRSLGWQIGPALSRMLKIAMDEKGVPE